jgi:hypothetical protein
MSRSVKSGAAVVCRSCQTLGVARRPCTCSPVPVIAELCTSRFRVARGCSPTATAQSAGDTASFGRTTRRLRFASSVNQGAAESYSWGRKGLNFVRCATCGCVMNWERVQPRKVNYVGVNARNFEPSDLGAVRIRLLDGANTWKYLD